MATGNGIPRRYTLSTETAGGAAKLVRLTNDINDDPVITTVLQYINTDEDDDTIDLFFEAPLSALEIVALDSLVASHIIGAATTRDFQFFESNPEQTTTLETFQSAFTRTAAPLEQGVYILTWYAEIRVVPVGPLNSTVNFRFQVDGTSKGNASTDSRLYVPVYGWDRFSGKDGQEPVLTIDYRRDPNIGGNDTVSIRRLKIGIESKSRLK